MQISGTRGPLPIAMGLFIVQRATASGRHARTIHGREAVLRRTTTGNSSTVTARHVTGERRGSRCQGPPHQGPEAEGEDDELFEKGKPHFRAPVHRIVAANQPMALAAAYMPERGYIECSRVSTKSSAPTPTYVRCAPSTTDSTLSISLSRLSS
jgi:hypothetical protein